MLLMRGTRPMDDRKLVEACIKKDLKSWSLLIAKYSRLVEIAAANRLKKYGFTLPKEDIEDIRQDVFTAIWSKDKLKSVADLNDISHWIAIVSGNMAMDRLRGSKNRELLDTIPIHEKFKEGYLADVLLSKKLRTEDDKAEKQLAKKIDAAMATLPCRERLIIELHLIHGKKYYEIVELLEMPYGTVSSYIKRAKERLRTKLKEFLIIFATISALFTSLYMGGL